MKHVPIALALLLLALRLLAADAEELRRDFVATMVEQHGWSAREVEAVLAQARYQQSIIDAISRPAEARPWHAYRPIFMTEARIRDGLAFYRRHGAALDAAAERFGVEREIILAILGVETSYGRITGRHRVLDALYTLGFHFAPRRDFFRRELEQFLLLSREEAVSLTEATGSYAGAMGWGQFIPSSYRAYAVDGDGDGRRDLWNSPADVFASIANYFKAHGWQAGAPVAVPARVDDGARELGRLGLEPVYPLSQLIEWGYHPAEALDLGDDDPPATLVTLEASDGPEHWITFRNFYVISRYNRSALYSMVIHQLAQELAQGLGR